MYDELVAVLRHCGNGSLPCEGCPRKMCEGAMANMREAADAIEELTAIAESYKRSMEAWADEAAIAQSRWIPVTEPPKEDGWYQVYAPGYSGGSSSGLKNINGNMYSAFKHGKWSIEVGYHKRPGCVKAWMPLPPAPEPPKEEA